MSDITDNLISQLINNLRQNLPLTFTRQYIVERLGGLVSVGGLSNLESDKKGPNGIKCGRYVLYEKESFLTWLENRIRSYNNPSHGDR